MLSPHELLYCRLGEKSIHDEQATVHLAFFVQGKPASLDQSFLLLPLPAGSCTEVQTLTDQTQPGGRQALHLLNCVGAVPACFKGKFYPVFIPAYKA